MKYLEILDGLYPEWHKDAACNGRDPALWFPVITPNHDRTAAREAATREGRRICNTECKVREICKASANENAEIFGVWGGDDREGWNKSDVA